MRISLLAFFLNTLPLSFAQSQPLPGYRLIPIDSITSRDVPRVFRSIQTVSDTLTIALNYVSYALVVPPRDNPAYPNLTAMNGQTDRLQTLEWTLTEINADVLTFDVAYGRFEGVKGSQKGKIREERSIRIPRRALRGLYVAQSEEPTRVVKRASWLGVGLGVIIVAVTAILLL